MTVPVATNPRAGTIARRRYRAHLAVLVVGGLLPPALAISVSAAPIAEADRNAERDEITLSRTIDDRYTQKVEVISVPNAEGYNPQLTVYVDNRKRIDCEVTGRYTDDPGVTCADTPAPTETDSSDQEGGDR